MILFQSWLNLRKYTQLNVYNMSTFHQNTYYILLNVSDISTCYQNTYTLLNVFGYIYILPKYIIYAVKWTRLNIPRYINILPS